MWHASLKQDIKHRRMGLQQRLTWPRAGVRAHSTQQHWPFPAEKTETGYAYVLTHPGTPCIFYDDLWSHGDKLRELIALRKRADITARSNVEIRCADADMYLACIDNKCAARLHAALLVTDPGEGGQLSASATQAHDSVGLRCWCSVRSLHERGKLCIACQVLHQKASQNR